MNTPEEVGARLRYLRTQKRMKIGEAADGMAISYAQYRKYEIGELYPPTAHLGTITGFYGVSADWLLGTGGGKEWG